MNTNNIKELDLSHNANLEILNCGRTEIKELDLSKNTKLKNSTAVHLTWKIWM